MVIGENPEEQLAPFQENNMGNCPEEYLEFNDMTESLKGDWAEEDEETKEKCKNDFDYYAADYQGYKKNDEGLYGYWENPNAKWDWYVLGGRWSGFFKMKPGTKGVEGKAGLFSEPAPQGTADAALKKDIDFGTMMEEASKEAGEKWDSINEITKGLDPIQSWEHVRENMFHGDIEKARSFYHGQPAIKAVNEWSSKNGYSLFGMNLEDFQCTREEYCLNAARGSFTPFAIIKDGKWHEKGEMGWFGVTSNEKNKDQWTAQVARMIDELPEETMIWNFDCHI
jgi:hypothetical protein